MAGHFIEWRYFYSAGENGMYLMYVIWFSNFSFSWIGKQEQEQSSPNNFYMTLPRSRSQGPVYSTYETRTV